MRSFMGCAMNEVIARLESQMRGLKLKGILSYFREFSEQGSRENFIVKIFFINGSIYRLESKLENKKS
jgi:hypothetical protein